MFLKYYKFFNLLITKGLSFLELLVLLVKVIVIRSLLFLVLVYTLVLRDRLGVLF